MFNSKAHEDAKPICQKCGLCCQLFAINLNEEEYRSGKFQTIFDDLALFEDFLVAQDCGANILKQQADGSCIYLNDKQCSIHETRPEVCRDFFCQGSEERYKGMREIIEAARVKS